MTAITAIVGSIFVGVVVFGFADAYRLGLREGRRRERDRHGPLINAVKAYLFTVQDELAFPESDRAALAEALERLTGWTAPDEPEHRP